MAVRTCYWQTSKGKRRCIRLYKAWRNMHARIAGKVLDGNGEPRWLGLENGFRDWHHFREWSLQNGFAKGMVLDRIDESRGYVPDNCQWITKWANAVKANAAHRDSCMCWACKKRKNLDAFLCRHGKLDCGVCDE